MSRGFFSIISWDVRRPNSSVDNSRAVVYNINVIKRKE
nr:MAG TPA: hypothetical protein [Caudoviricetes sp.]